MYATSDPTNLKNNVQSRQPSGLSQVSQQQTIANLEGKIAFLKKQHSDMLGALHNEVEQLKQKNKELQFQLVMRGFSSQMSLTGKNKNEDQKDSPVQVLQAPSFQLESLESNMKKLQADLHEARSRNIYLTDLVEEQRRKLAEVEFRQSARGVVPPNNGHSSFPLASPEGPDDSDHSLVSSATSTVVSNTPVRYRQSSFAEETEVVNRQLKRAEMAIEQLQQENIRQRQEIMELSSCVDRSARMKFRGCNHPIRLLNRAQKPHEKGDAIVAKDSLLRWKRLGTSMNSLNDNRFPPLKALPVKRKQSRSPIHPELPPVPGSSGSDSSLLASSKRPPLNLVSLEPFDVARNRKPIIMDRGREKVMKSTLLPTKEPLVPSQLHKMMSVTSVRRRDYKQSSSQSRKPS